MKINYLHMKRFLIHDFIDKLFKITALFANEGTLVLEIALD